MIAGVHDWQLLAWAVGNMNHYYEGGGVVGCEYVVRHAETVHRAVLRGRLPDVGRIASVLHAFRYAALAVLAGHDRVDGHVDSL